MFGLFQRKEADQPIRDRLADLEREVRGLKLDFEELYDRVRSALGKISKRAALVAAAEAQGGETAQDAPGSPNGDGQGEDAFSAQVRAMRRHGSVRRAQ